MASSVQQARMPADEAGEGWAGRRPGSVLSRPAWSVSFSPRIVSGLAALADGVVVFGTGFVIYLLYVGQGGEVLARYLSILTLSTALVLSSFSFGRLYDLEALTHPSRHLRRIVILCAFAFMMVVSLAFALKISASFSRVWAFSWFFSATLLICLDRAASHALLKMWAERGRLTRNVAVVGAGEQSHRLVDALAANADDPWLKIVGVFDDRTSRTPPAVGEVPMLGDLDRLVDFARERRVDDILVALPWAAEARLLSIFDKLKVLPVHIVLSPDVIGLGLSRRNFERIRGIPCLKVSAKPITGWEAVLKAVEDRVLAALVLLLAQPLMVVIAAAIKLDSPGPVLFRQKRYGFNKQVIEVFKFRTMVHDPDPDPSAPQATRHDPRVTRVGAFLRRTSLDELPQFLNVLRGEMSVVGPRPHAVAHDEKYARIIDRYLGRHKVKPGITGWAQVNGWRGEIDSVKVMKNRIEHDLEYIETWSVMRDVLIVLRTIWIVLRGDNAY